MGLSAQPGAILGHEFCGVVEEVGKDVRNFKKGDRVVVPFSQGDGTCEYCRNGQSNVCLTPLLPGFSYHGGFGHLVAVPFADMNLVTLPPSIDFVEAASMGCRFMTSFHGIVDRAQVKPGEWVVVHGCGGIGLSAINIAAAMGANVIGVDLDSAKLELAKGMGATHVINAKKTDPIAAILDLTGGGAHVSVDALGIAATCRNSIMSLRKQGRHLQIGLTTAAEQGEIPVPIDRMVTMELQIDRIARDAGVALSGDAADGRGKEGHAQGDGDRHLRTRRHQQDFRGDEHVPERRRHGDQQLQLDAHSRSRELTRERVLSGPSSFVES